MARSHDIGSAADIRELPLLALQHQHRGAHAEMFRAVFAKVRAYLDTRSQATTSSALLSGGNTG